MAHWLLKTEPSSYSFADLERERVTAWTGVKNPQAQEHLKAMKAGDRVLVYHSGAKVAVGVAEVTRPAYADPTSESGGRVCVDVRAVAPLPNPVALADLRALPAFDGSPLLRQGRLSVVPLTAAQWAAVEGLARRARA